MYIQIFNPIWQYYNWIQCTYAICSIELRDLIMFDFEATIFLFENNFPRKLHVVYDNNMQYIT